jgi:hypothetical protein
MVRYDDRVALSMMIEGSGRNIPALKTLTGPKQTQASSIGRRARRRQSRGRAISSSA